MLVNHVSLNKVMRVSQNDQEITAYSPTRVDGAVEPLKEALQVQEP